MKALRKCLYLIFGLFIFGLVSCANDSSSNDTYVPARNTDTDKSGQAYRDGFYEFSDGNTTIYLYFENKSLVSAGNAQGKYPSSQIEVLKQSYSWNTVRKYCTRYEVSLNSTKWMLGVYPAEKLFKKGWYDFYFAESGRVVGYFETYNSKMSYVAKDKDDRIIRTNIFDNNNSYYSSDTWESLLHRVANSNNSSLNVTLESENLEYYSEQ